MGLRYYDEALVEKIESWVQGSRNVRVLRPDETNRLYMMTADLESDKIKLPLIALSRDTTVELLQPSRTVKSFDGIMLESDGKHTIQLNAIPVKLNYQLDIYTQRYDEGDEYLRDFIFHLVNHSGFYVKIPYNGRDYKHIAHITLDTTAEDTSAAQQRLFEGQFTRWTLTFSINDAYLFSVPYVNNVSMETPDGSEVITADETDEIEAGEKD